MKTIGRLLLFTLGCALFRVGYLVDTDNGLFSFGWVVGITLQTIGGGVIYSCGYRDAKGNIINFLKQHIEGAKK